MTLPHCKLKESHWSRQKRKSATVTERWPSSGFPSSCLNRSYGAVKRPQPSREHLSFSPPLNREAFGVRVTKQSWDLNQPGCRALTLRLGWWKKVWTRLPRFMFKYKDLCNLTSNVLYLRYNVSKQNSSLVEEEGVISSPIRKLLLFRKEVNLCLISQTQLSHIYHLKYSHSNGKCTTKMLFISYN